MFIRKVRLGMEKGKVVVKEFGNKKNQDIHITQDAGTTYNITYITSTGIKKPKIEDEIIICWNCENEVESGQKYCHECGIEL